MAEIVDMIDKIKRYYKFSPSELRSLAVAIIITAFIISFREWGVGSAFDAKSGLFNFFNAILIVAVSFIIHLSAQRVWALATGYRHEFQMWGIGLGIALILAFVTNGRAWLIIPGGFIVHHLAGHRLGWFRYGINYWAIALIAFAGPLASIIFAIVFKSITGFVSNALMQKVIIFNLLYAVYSMLPIPPLDGSKIFYGGRLLYAFGIAGIVAAAVLLYTNIPIWIAVVSAFLIAVVLWLLYYIFFEKDYWGG
jgi:Zn-dependent protease